MVVADFVQDQRVQQWLDGVEPAWTLLTRYWSIRPRSPKGSPWIVRHRRMVPGYFGGPVDAVRAWIRAAGISDGPLFHPVTCTGKVSARQLSTREIGSPTGIGRPVQIRYVNHSKHWLGGRRGRQ